MRQSIKILALLALGLLIINCRKVPTPVPTPPKVAITVKTVGEGRVQPTAAKVTKGNRVNFTATPNVGWQLIEWIGEGIDAPNSVDVSVLADKPKVITAKFSKLPSPLIATAIYGKGTIVANPPTGWNKGDEVTFTATSRDDHRFVSWLVVSEGGKKLTSSYDPVLEVTADYIDIHAVFEVDSTSGFTWPESSPDLRKWLNQHTNIRDAINLEVYNESDDPILLNYRDWPSNIKTSLFDLFDNYCRGNFYGFDDPLPNSVPQTDTEQLIQGLSVNDGLDLYLTHVAYSLYQEVQKGVCWSVLDYDAASLAVLFDSREFFTATKPNDPKTARYGIRTYKINEKSLPCPPRASRVFLADMVGQTKRQTIENLLQWVRLNVIHAQGSPNSVPMAEAQWQYRGFTPASRIIAGTPFTGKNNAILHRSMGCQGTTAFLKSVLRSVNIPVTHNRSRDNGGHNMAGFPTERLYLSHSDDPYSSYFKHEDQIPISELLITEEQFNEWFADKTDDPNVGRQVRFLAIKYLSQYLLNYYCDDLQSGVDRANGTVVEKLRNWSVAELESMDLWTRMDAKLLENGGCSGSMMRATIPVTDESLTDEEQVGEQPSATWTIAAVLVILALIVAPVVLKERAKIIG